MLVVARTEEGARVLEEEFGELLLAGRRLK
jgi:hypothetical protein